MTSRQFQVMVDVLTNLLFARLPKYVMNLCLCYQFFLESQYYDDMLLYLAGITSQLPLLSYFIQTFDLLYHLFNIYFTFFYVINSTLRDNS